MQVPLPVRPSPVLERGELLEDGQKVASTWRSSISEQSTPHKVAVMLTKDS